METGSYVKSNSTSSQFIDADWSAACEAEMREIIASKQVFSHYLSAKMMRYELYIQVKANVSSLITLGLKGHVDSVMDMIK